MRGARARDSRRSMIEFRRQRVRTQAQLHQRLGLRQTGSREPMVHLIPKHGVMGAGVPLAAGVALEVTLANQCLLNFLCALWLQVEARQALLAR